MSLLPQCLLRCKVLRKKGNKLATLWYLENNEIVEQWISFATAQMYICGQWNTLLCHNGVTRGDVVCYLARVHFHK
jgi:hypothetical protein